jgi:flagellar hook-associated protein 2
LGLRFDPVGGGMFKQAVKTIVEAESEPIKKLEARKGKENTRLKLFNEFRSKFAGLDKAVDEISAFKRLRELKVNLGDGAPQVDVTVDKDRANPGTYEISVEELAARTSVISNSFENPEKPVMGMGFITLDMPDGDTKELYVEEDASSLRGIARLINEQADFPVRAAVVKDASNEDKPWKLIMTAKKDGQANGVKFPDFYFLDGEEDFFLDDTRDAKNASLKVDGFPIELESNDVQDFLPGVNLHLKQAKPDQPFTMTITEDFQKISGKVKNFVEQVNVILKFINDQNKIDKDSDTSTTFAGDSGLQTIEYRLRNLMHEGFAVGKPDDENFKIYFMHDLGIEFDKTGTLTFKEDKFQKFMEKDFEGLSEIFTGSFGLGYQMKSLLAGYTQSGNGMLAQRENSLKQRIRSIDDQIDMKQRNLERRQQSLTEQFSRLEASLGAMQRQQQYLSATLPGAGGGGNLVQSLLGG